MATAEVQEFDDATKELGDKIVGLTLLVAICGQIAAGATTIESHARATFGPTWCLLGIALIVASVWLGRRATDLQAFAKANSEMGGDDADVHAPD